MPAAGMAAEGDRIMKYNVKVVTEGGPDVLLGTYGTVAMAQRVARKAAQTHDQDGKRVYVDWFRASDGQHGYLNPGQGHSIIGKPW